MLLLVGKQVAIGIDEIASAVDVALNQQTQDGVVHAVLSINLLDAGINGSGHKLCHTHLVDMGVLGKGVLDVRHIRTATSQDDATQQLVIVLSRNLIADILDNLLDTSLHNLNEATALHLALCINRVFQVGVYIVVVGIG